MKLRKPALQLNLEYIGSPQPGLVLNGYGISIVPQGSQVLGVGSTQYYCKSSVFTKEKEEEKVKYVFNSISTFLISFLLNQIHIYYYLIEIKLGAMLWWENNT